MNKEIANLRDVIVKLTQLLAGQGLRVTQQGSQAYVRTNATTLKPELVNIPYLPDNASPELILAIQGFIDHEIAHILFTDWSVVKAAVAMGRGIDVMQNIVEDTFIEREVGKKFPGAVYNLGRLHDFFLAQITTPALNKPEVKGNPMAEFSVLIVPIARAWSGQKVFQEWLTKNKYWDHPVVKAFVDRMDPKVVASMPFLKNSQECLDVALEMDRAINEGKKKPDGGKGEGDGEGTPEKTPHGDKSESKKSGAKASDAKPEEEAKGEEEKTDDDSDDAEGPAGSAEAGDDDAGEESDAKSAGEPEEEADEEADGDGAGAPEPSDDAADGEAGADSGDDDGDDASGSSKAKGSSSSEDGEEDLTSKRYNTTMEDSDEIFKPSGVNFEHSRFEGAIEELITNEAVRATKGAPYRIFSKDFDIMEKPKQSRYYQPAMLARLEDETRHMVSVMQKDIERMMSAKSIKQNIPGYRSGRLHTAGLHKLVTGDDRVFRRKHEAQSKDTVVGLLIDNSGSMSGSKMETAMKVGYALSQTLERVGIAHEVLGFTTCQGTEDYDANVIMAESRRLGVRYSRTEPIYMPIYKEFAERLTPTVKSRFADAAKTQTFLSQNIDGEAVEVAVGRLLKRPEKRRVLLVLSDGNPSCLGDTRAINSHLHEMIAQAQKNKVELVGIGIESDSVKTFYPKCFVLKDVAELPRVVMGELKRILTAA